MTGPARTRPVALGPAIARRLAALVKRDMLSANLAIGTASVFVLVTAAASLAVDRDAPAPLDAAWRLRGSLSRVEMRDPDRIRAPVRREIGRSEIKHSVLARLSSGKATIWL